METHAEIAIKKWIEKNPDHAIYLKGKMNEHAISLLASYAKVSPAFIEQNLQTIRNWI